MKILKINTSARTTDSISRELVDLLADKYKSNNDVEITHRDLLDGVSLLTEAHIQAFYTGPDDRTSEQKTLLQSNQKGSSLNKDD